jgi:hypothetical protein
VALLCYELRPDGFAYLEPVGGWGQFATRCIVPRGKDIRINYQAPAGQVLVQVSDVQRRPLKGYRFSDCIPLTGDKTHVRVRWQQHPDVSELIGKRIRLEFRMADARVYALRLACDLAYTNMEKPIERI